MYNKVLRQLADKPYFTLTAIKQLVGGTDQASCQLAYRWVKANKIVRLKQNVYMSRLFYDRFVKEPGFLEMVSAIIQPTAYVSREYALQKYGVMTEAIYTVTAVTVKNTGKVQNQMALFDYRHIKESLYTGWVDSQNFGITCHMASKAKALFDYLYFKPSPRYSRKKEVSIIEDYRLNLEDFTSGERLDFVGYIRRVESEKMNYYLKNIRRWLWRD